MHESEDPNKCFHHTIGGAQIGGNKVCRDHFPNGLALDNTVETIAGRFVSSLPTSYNVDVNIKDVSVVDEKLLITIGQPVASTSYPDTVVRLPLDKVRELAQTILQLI